MYSSVDPDGSVMWEGPLSLQHGNHDHMPARTEAYLEGDERGHVNASSLGGENTKQNVVAQHRDLNHGAYYQMESGERSALKNCAAIDSTKIAYVNSQPGGRPSAFMVNDTVTYADGHTEAIHHSFTNISNAEQQANHDLSANYLDELDAPNPNDGLREQMSAKQYAELMEATDAELPGIAEEYAPASAAGMANAETSASASIDDDFGVYADCDLDDM